LHRDTRLGVEVAETGFEHAQIAQPVACVDGREVPQELVALKEAGIRTIADLIALT
jgi:hypothetical protein